jgi:hypothetical protein
MIEERTYVSSLSLENIGRFEDITLHMNPFTLLVGPNDAGKTTALEALQTVCGHSNLDLQQVRRDETKMTRRAPDASVEAIIQNPPEDLVDRSNLNNGDAAGLRIEWEITGDTEEDANLETPNYYLRERVPEDERLHEWDYYAQTEKEILEEYGYNPGSNAEKRKEQYEELKAEFLQNPEDTDLDWVSCRKQEFRSFAPATEQIDTEDVDSPQKLLSKLLRQETESFLHLDDDADEPRRIDELLEIEQRATEALNERLESLSGRMNRYLPGIEEITVDPDWSFVNGADFSNIVLSRNGESIPLQELGGGTTARSALSMLEWSTETNDGKQSVIRTMDEPDHRLHFDVQRRLISLLRNDIPDEESYLSQCIVSTHSLIMVDATPLHEVVYLPDEVDLEEERSPLLTRDEAEAGELMGNIMTGLGLSASWVYLERAMIVVEGATEYNYINEIYHKITGSTLVEDGIQVWDCQGCGHIVRTLERLQEAGRAQTFVILDTDAKDRKTSDETLEPVLEDMYEAGGSEPELVWIGDKELEDMWRKDDLKRLAEEHWPRGDGNDWKVNHFNSVDEAEKPSGEIVNVIKQGCAQNIQDCPNVTKEHIGLRMGRLEGVDHPDKIVSLLEYAHKCCSRDREVTPE